MPTKSTSRLRTLREIGFIVYRNVVLLINAIIFSVAALLIIFGDIKAGVFLGIILLFNMVVGILQESRAWLALQRLQLLTALHVTRINADGSETKVFTEEIQKDNVIKLQTGDQVPCDGILQSSLGMEINQALITGESNSVLVNTGTSVVAGSIITSGSGVMLVEKIYQESRISRMTEGIKKHSIQISPLQKSIAKAIRYCVYILLLVITITIIRSFIVQEPAIFLIKSIGALASMIVPQGVVFATTIFFAYGAASLYKKNVLLQQVNATERLGLIKNLCMDKTGTLTENELTVEELYVPDGSDSKIVRELISIYSKSSSDNSQTIIAINKFVGRAPSVEVEDILPFSSWRQYGAIKIKRGKQDLVLLVGAPETFQSHITATAEQVWLETLIKKHTPNGKRLLCLVRSDQNNLLHDFNRTNMSVLGVFVLSSKLRPGIRDAINFFQNRGVRIRIISGDNAETVKQISHAAGVIRTEAVITGTEIQLWNEEDFDLKAKDYTIFARIKPEQKEKIISALQADGFTAMVGDGANDALAIKKADLGIAMFDGAPATRQLASVVLMNNSFTALPAGVALADTIIAQLETFGSLFFNQVALGVFIFILISVFGYSYPITPLNITFINYFVIALPSIVLAYWTVRPTGASMIPSNGKTYMRRILPFAIASAMLGAIGTTIAFLYSPPQFQNTQSNILVILSYIFFGVLFFFSAPGVYDKKTTDKQKISLAAYILLAIFLITIGLNWSWAIMFYELTPLPQISIISLIGFIFFGISAQFLLTYWFSRRYRHEISKKTTLKKLKKKAHIYSQ